eukprot:Skav225079  [mRNA]  locus=scaffold987:216519:225234:- [translate_table: standard]
MECLVSSADTTAEVDSTRVEKLKMEAHNLGTVATTIKSHCCLGLTATLVREDDLIQDLHWLIGPKLYEANWQQLQDEGYLARVRCIEVWCDMSEEFFIEYLQAQDSEDIPGSMRAAMQRALWTCNPNKLKTCEFLIRHHEQRGDKIIVFSDNIFILQLVGDGLSAGECTHADPQRIPGERSMQHHFPVEGPWPVAAGGYPPCQCDRPDLFALRIQTVGFAALGVSNAPPKTWQEAQRLGRILRPKPQATNTAGGFNAFFYSVVSRDTQELYHANRRQQFLVEQGYNYQAPGFTLHV